MCYGETDVTMHLRSWITVFSTALAASCWTAPQPEFEEAPPTLSHLPEPSPAPAGKGARTSAPETSAPIGTVNGIDVSALDDKQKHAWWKLVSSLYSPCTDQAVGLVQCINESRPCAGCVPMARFIADRIKGGASSVDAEAAAAIRFGPETKKVELRDSPSVGPKDAPVTIVVWSDFECPHCARGIPILEKFQKEHASNVRLVHKFYPLTKKHLKAKGAAIAAYAAQRQGKYWEMEKMLFENQDALDPTDLERYAKKVGLDLTTYRNDVAAGPSEAIVDRDIADGDEAGLHSTPFILINGRHFDLDYFKYPDLDSWVALELELAPKASEPAAPKP